MEFAVPRPNNNRLASTLTYEPQSSFEMPKGENPCLITSGAIASSGL